MNFDSPEEKSKVNPQLEKGKDIFGLGLPDLKMLSGFLNQNALMHGNFQQVIASLGVLNRPVTFDTVKKYFIERSAGYHRRG